MNRKIRIASLRRLPLLDSYEHNGLLGRLGKWLFSKLSRPVHQFQESADIREIDVDGVVEAICKQADACEMIWNRDIEFVLVGPDEQHGLFRDMQSLDFCARARIGDGKQVVVRGIPVKFVPWATGITCIPKDR